MAVPDVTRVLDNIMNKREDCSWGPNNAFKFPRHGGTGAIWRAMAKRLSQEKIHPDAELTAVDAERKRLKFKEGRTEEL